MNAARHRAYLRLCRTLKEDTGVSLSPGECELLCDLAEDLFLSPGSREQAAAQTCQAGAALLAGLMRSERLDRADAEALWRNLCDCGPAGLWRPFGSSLSLAAKGDRARRV